MKLTLLKKENYRGKILSENFEYPLVNLKTLKPETHNITIHNENPLYFLFSEDTGEYNFFLNTDYSLNMKCLNTYPDDEFVFFPLVHTNKEDFYFTREKEDIRSCSLTKFLPVPYFILDSEVINSFENNDENSEFRMKIWRMMSSNRFFGNKNLNFILLYIYINSETYYHLVIKDADFSLASFLELKEGLEYTKKLSRFTEFMIGLERNLLSFQTQSIIDKDLFLLLDKKYYQTKELVPFQINGYQSLKSYNVCLNSNGKKYIQHKNYLFQIDDDSNLLDIKDLFKIRTTSYTILPLQFPFSTNGFNISFLNVLINIEEEKPHFRKNFPFRIRNLL